MPANLENSAGATRLENVSFSSIQKQTNKQRMLKHTIALIAHASQVMLKILQARFQQYVNHELSVVQTGFRKVWGTRDQIANICWIIEKAREFQKITYFCFIDYAKAFDCVDHNKWGKILKEMGIPGHLTSLLRNLRAGQQLIPDLELQFNSVKFSHLVVSYSLRPHEPQHTRSPRPSPVPGVHLNPCPSSQWCHLAISSSVIPFSSCPQSFPASGSFQMSQLFTSDVQVLEFQLQH